MPQTILQHFFRSVNMDPRAKGFLSSLGFYYSIFPPMIDLQAQLSYSICLNDEMILQKIFLCVTYSDMQRM